MKKGAPPIPYPRHKPGTTGVIIRHRHGWEDGKVTAMITRDDGDGYVAKDIGTGVEYDIRHTRDFRADPPKQGHK